MPPHGRRRTIPSSLPFFLLAISLFLPSVLAASGVLGIDIGTEYIKASLVKPGIPLEIVLTKDSKRKELSAVAFKPGSLTASSSQEIFPERAYGSDAVALTARFPGDVYANLKPLLGLSASSPLLSSYTARYPGLLFQECRERPTVCLKSDTFESGEEAFAVEELLGMQLQNIRTNAEVMAGKGSAIRDVVITIPNYYTAEEKRAVETAAALAGFRILCMTTDGLAVGLQYATTRTFPVVSDGAKPEYHLVFDMGAGSAKATVIKFQGRTVKDVGKFNKTVQEVQVMGAGWDRSLGGDALNAVIMEDLVRAFAESKPMVALGAGIEDIKKNARSVAKLWKESERMRQVLSANTETYASFEGLYNGDVNFKYKITRAHFEKMAAGYEERVKYPIVQALEMAKLELGDLESVILHGGATRTPFVQRALEAAVGKADMLKTNVNSDEAAAFGAAFKAAGISPSFRVKDIRTSEAAIVPVEISWVAEGKERSQRIFVANSLAGKDKQVPFKLTEDFSFDLSQQVPEGVAGTRRVPVSRTETTNLTASVKELKDKHGCEDAEIRTQFSIRLSSVNGLPEVSQGSVSCEVVDNKKASVVDGVKDFFGFGDKKDNQEVMNDDDEASATPLDVKTPTSSKADTKSTASKESKSKGDKSKDEKAKEDKVKEPEKKIQVIYVGFTKTDTGLPQPGKAEMQRIKDRMKAFDSSDKNRKLREEALNSLEGFTYKLRDLIEDPGFIAASVDSLRAEIESKAHAAGEWIYGDGANAKLAEFRDRLKELRDLVDPVLDRQSEASKRPEEVNALRQSLEQTKSLMATLTQKNEERKVAAEAKSASLAAASSSSSTTSTASVDDLDALDDTAVPSEEVLLESLDGMGFEMPALGDEELAQLNSQHDKVEKWLQEKLEAQEKLAPTEAPAFTVAEIKQKVAELQNLAVELISKQMETFNLPGAGGKSKAKSKSKSKSKKPKTKKGKKGTSADAVETPTPTAPLAEDETVPATEPSPDKGAKDEL